MTTHTPDIRILRVWRINLTLAAILPAFAIALLLKAGSFWWSLLSAVWAVLFLLAYLVYLPLLYKSIAYAMKDNRIIIRYGVFMRKTKTMALSSVQYFTLSQNLVGRLFGLASLVFTAPGGRLYLPGFPVASARRLFLAFTAADRAGQEESL